MILCLVLFTYLFVLMNDVVMLRRLDLVYGLLWYNIHKCGYEESL
jgi:hypothetical protein